jgi:hypothetical protein
MAVSRELQDSANFSRSTAPGTCLAKDLEDPRAYLDEVESKRPYHLPYVFTSRIITNSKVIQINSF